MADRESHVENGSVPARRKRRVVGRRCGFKRMKPKEDELLHSDEQGYPRLADAMHRYSDMAIFRKFEVLNLQNLLYLQAELTRLEDEFARDYLAPECHVRGEKVETVDLQTSFKELSRHGGPGKAHWAHLKKIQVALADYNTALLQQAKLQRLPAPYSRQRAKFNAWFPQKQMGSGQLVPGENLVYHDHQNDLVALGEVEQDTKLTRWLHGWVTTSVSKYIIQPLGIKRVDPDFGVYRYESSTTIHLAKFMVLLLASLTPTFPIFILYEIHTLIHRIAFITGYTTAFAIILWLTTEAKNVEVFAGSLA
jgi:hypothetical protein